MTVQQVAIRCRFLADQCAAAPLDQRDTPAYRNLFAEYAAACFELRRLRQDFGRK